MSLANYLYENRWLVGLRGVVAVLFGISAFIWPGLTALALIFLFGAYSILDGILTISASLRNRTANDRWGWMLLEGVVDIIAGVIVFVFPAITAVVAVFVIAIWAIIRGLLELVMAIRLRQEINNEWLLALGGIASIILGVIMIINPGAGLIGLVWAIAGYAIVFGILMIALAFRAGRMGEGRRSQEISA